MFNVCIARKNVKVIIAFLILLVTACILMISSSFLLSVKPKSHYQSPPLDLLRQDENQSLTDPPSLDDVSAQYSLRHDREPPKKFREWFEFANSKKCFTDMSMYDAIYKDLAPFFALGQHDFKKRLQALTKGDFWALNVLKVSGGKASGAVKHRVQSFAEFLPDLQAVFNALDEPRVLYSLSKGELVPWNNDYKMDEPFVSPQMGEHEAYLQNHCNVRSEKRPWRAPMNNIHGFTIQPDSTSYTSELLPILSPAIIEGCFSDIRYPSEYYTSAQHSGMKGTLKWQDRKEIMFWRGKTSGGHALANNFERFHRERVNALAFNSSDLYDIAFTDAIQCESEDCQAIRKKYRFDYSVPLEKNFEHKYLLDVDGNTFSGRFFSFLYSGSLVFKATIFKEHFEGWMKPYEHYIPIEMDFSDLEVKLKWAMSHDMEAKRIAANAKAFALEHLHDDQADCYLFLLLLEIARLQGSE